MDNLGISTEPSFLEVELPQTLLESPSTSTFLPDEEASICPLLSNSSALGPALLSHPLSPNIVASDITSSNISNTDCKADSSSSGSSTGIAMDAMESTSTNLFNNVNYHHLQNNNTTTNQDTNSHCLMGNRRKSKETPGFVSWNWPLIRKCTFFVFLSGILAMCSIIVAKIVSMPKYCNPKTAWYRGSVLYEINPAAFKDTDNNGIGDINGIINSIDYLTDLGVSGVRLNSIFPSVPDNDGHFNASVINDIRPELGNLSDIKKLANVLYTHNMTLLLDLPLNHVIPGRNEGELINLVVETLYHWIEHGVNGFYLKGIDTLTNAAQLKCLASWKRILGQNRVIIVEESVLKFKTKSETSLIFEHIDLVDIVLNIENDAHKMKERIKMILAEMPVGEEKTWVQWSINNTDNSEVRKKIFAATIMQLMLPGTPNILHSNGKSIAHNNKYNYTDQQLWAEELYNLTDQYINVNSSHNLNMVKRMISLRERSPSIYKNFLCKSNADKPNTQIVPYSNNDIIIIVRNYPRKNSFALITNFGNTKVKFDLTSYFYSGDQMLIGSNEKIYFKQFKIDAFDSIVVKLDK